MGELGNLLCQLPRYLVTSPPKYAGRTVVRHVFGWCATHGPKEKGREKGWVSEVEGVGVGGLVCVRWIGVRC